MRKQAPVVILANKVVSILDALKLVGVYVSKSDIYTKMHCPFGSVSHSDGGVQRTFQIYDDNRAYCYNCVRVYDPVSLAQAAWDLPQKQAAAELLHQSGYKPPTTNQRWTEIEQSVAVKPDKASLGQALKLYCSTIDENWEERQFDKDIADKLNKCLSLLERVHTDDDVIEWLAGTKWAMAAALKRT